jgi:hypothetical protein
MRLFEKRRPKTFALSGRGIFQQAGKKFSKVFCQAFFQKSAFLLIPTVIKNDRWYKPYFWRAAAPPAPRAKKPRHFHAGVFGVRGGNLS